MPLYFFDIHQDGKTQKDALGTDFETLDEARAAAVRFLPDVVKEGLSEDDDQRSFAVLVTDESGRPVYSATLSFTGLRLQR